MATYTNLNIPKLANAALEGFVKELVALSVFSTSFSGEEVGTRTRGNVVLVPLVGALTATTFGGTYAVSGGTKSVVTVTINRHKVVHIGQSDLDALDNSDSALETFGFQQGAALAQAVVEDVLTLVTTANFASVTAVASTALDVPQLRAARLALNQANAPKKNRFALIDAVGYDALLSVTNFVQAHMFADNQVLKEGRIMRAMGFDFHELNGSFVSAASVNAFVGHASAIAIAMRYLAPQKPSEYDNAGAYTDPKSGATIGLRDFYDPATGMRYIALEANFGKSAGITNGARIIKRTD
jgi:hypothetical protein